MVRDPRGTWIHVDEYCKQMEELLTDIKNLEVELEKTKEEHPLLMQFKISEDGHMIADDKGEWVHFASVRDYIIAVLEEEDSTIKECEDTIRGHQWTIQHLQNKIKELEGRLSMYETRRAGKSFIQNILNFRKNKDTNS